MRTHIFYSLQVLTEDILEVHLKCLLDHVESIQHLVKAEYETVQVWANEKSSLGGGDALEGPVEVVSKEVGTTARLDDLLLQPQKLCDRSL